MLAQIQKLVPPQVFRGLDISKRGGRDYEFNEIPGLIEAGWTQADYEAVKETEEKTFEEQCDDILKALNEHENAWPFRQPVTQKQAPDYYNVIKEPMWIERIREKLQNKEYTEREMFKRDVMLIFENARVYNAKDTFFYKLADILQTFSQPLLDKLKETK